MYETLIGVLFSAGAVGAYLLTAKIINHERLASWRNDRRPRLSSCARRRRRSMMTGEELSRHFTGR
ncbi:MAG TPA: hypothetical protein VM870_05475 [Pyrinomonadaceae bacterium]|jgi:hypothetical protein|nr:hypothetical protein [Pyrinomonadaceae bacterium]